MIELTEKLTGETRKVAEADLGGRMTATEVLGGWRRRPDGYWELVRADGSVVEFQRHGSYPLVFYDEGRADHWRDAQVYLRGLGE